MNELYDKVLNVVADEQDCPKESLTLETRFDSLDMDSLDFLCIISALQTKFNVVIPKASIVAMETIADTAKAVEWEVCKRELREA